MHRKDARKQFPRTSSREVVAVTRGGHLQVVETDRDFY